MAVLYDVPAPAKLNLFLHVVGRRPDGYHLLQTVFRFVDLCDSLDFESTADGVLAREGEGLASLPADQDLVLRAACALQRVTGARQGARIRYRKRIPAGGGLGGGSSDAATTLIALNRLWGTGLTRAELMRLALPLGADVPVFVFGRAAFAQGIGEQLTAVDLPERTYWIVRPQAHVATADVFRASDLTRNSRSVKITDFTEWQTGPRDRRAAGLFQSKKPLDEDGVLGCDGGAFFGRNDLEAVVFRQHPDIAALVQVMRGAGVEIRMTGSGSCLFAEFPDAARARMHRDQIISKMEDPPDAAIQGSWICQGLGDHPLLDWVDD
ncbi:MAG: 4-(cytidine 5'-diphospho)-2-C-methyl-D-erythritol kinase [Castellaniella sp.]|uniref:4-(cytidine 5'-diphospho)-2-C-methyl-D-erythritol kinase n=1 Tax=Castellaniella sp. TaxID=1955812 RepID=UPI003A8AE955